jgi:hypothetical protein
MACFPVQEAEVVPDDAVGGMLRSHDGREGLGGTVWRPTVFG